VGTLIFYSALLSKVKNPNLCLLKCTVSFETFIETENSCCASQLPLIVTCYKISYLQLEEPSIIRRTLSFKPGLGKHFLWSATLKTSLLPGIAYIASVIALEILTKTFYIS